MLLDWRLPCVAVFCAGAAGYVFVGWAWREALNEIAAVGRVYRDAEKTGLISRSGPMRGLRHDLERSRLTLEAVKQPRGICARRSTSVLVVAIIVTAAVFVYLPSRCLPAWFYGCLGVAGVLTMFLGWRKSGSVPK